MLCYFGGGEELDHGGIEGWQVLWAAAGNPVAVVDDFLVNPVGTGVADVILDGIVARHGATSHEV